MGNCNSAQEEYGPKIVENWDIYYARYEKVISSYPMNEEDVMKLKRDTLNIMIKEYNKWPGIDLNDHYNRYPNFQLDIYFVFTLLDTLENMDALNSLLKEYGAKNIFSLAIIYYLDERDKTLGNFVELKQYILKHNAIVQQPPPYIEPTSLEEKKSNLLTSTYEPITS